MNTQSPNDALLAARAKFKTLSTAAFLETLAPRAPLQDSLNEVFKAATAEGVDAKLALNAISKTSIVGAQLDLVIPEI